jgi:hypothetical protein
VDFLQFSSPITAAGPSLNFTEFPYYTLKGYLKTTGKYLMKKKHEVKQKIQICWFFVKRGCAMNFEFKIFIYPEPGKFLFKILTFFIGFCSTYVLYPVPQA